jgi:enamine deaminase RidA (YjgF/YER057c/UK114 family)
MSRAPFIAVLLCCGLVLPSLAQSPYDGFEKPRKKSKNKKKDEEPATQVLPLPKDLPQAIAAETDRLTFFNSPLSSKGLLTAQTRDALRSLIAASKGSTIVKLRAFVAGSGDTRRVQTLVGEVMTEKKLPLPALSTIQVGSLGMEGAQVLIEAIAVERRPLNPQGLAFISGQAAKTFHDSVASVNKALSAANASDILSMTCFVSSLEETQADRAAASLPSNAIVVQMRREPSPTAAECEAVARLKVAPATPVALLNPEGLTQSPNYAQIALVNAPRVVFTGLQIAFHDQPPDARLAFDRLAKTLESVSVSYANVFFAHTYALTAQAIELVRGVRFSYLDQAHPPASTLLPFEGLPALDASFAMEVVAAVP